MKFKKDNLNSSLLFKEQMNNVNELLPIGSVIMWYGSIENIPNNWALCNGENNTPDLRNRFIIGAGDEYQLNDIGGQKEVILTVEQMPEHTHGWDYPVGVLLKSGTSSTGANGYSRTAPTITTSTGGSQPHPNMPPYYALYYIMKIK